MFRNKELFGRGMEMELDVERLAYMYLVNEEERMILSGQEEMKFSDFRRHEYLTAFFEFKSYNIQLWNQFAGRFESQFQSLVGLINEEGEFFPDLEYDWEEQNCWIENFYRNAPEGEQEWLWHWIEEKKAEMA